MAALPPDMYMAVPAAAPAPVTDGLADPSLASASPLPAVAPLAASPTPEPVTAPAPSLADSFQSEQAQKGERGSNDASAGTKAGIVIAVLAGLLLLAVLAVYGVKWARARRQASYWAMQERRRAGAASELPFRTTSLSA
jgi:hypothetical protein